MLPHVSACPLNAAAAVGGPMHLQARAGGAGSSKEGAKKQGSAGSGKDKLKAAKGGGSGKGGNDVDADTYALYHDFRWWAWT